MNGNVGIGLTNPSYTLDIKSGGTPLRIGSTHTGYGATIEMDANVYGAGGRRWIVFSSGSTNGTIGGGKFALYDASGISPDSAAYRFLIDTAGNVGIGTTNPIAKLAVSNNGAEGIEINPSGGTSYITSYNRSGGAYAPLYLIGHSGQNLAILSTGISVNNNFGVGTTAPNRNLEIMGAATAAGAGLRLSNVAGSTYFWDIWRDNTTGYLNFGSALGGAISNYMTIKDTGNVGIGATNPGAKLDVASGSIRINRGYSVGGYYANHTNEGTKQTYFGNWVGGTFAGMRINTTWDGTYNDEDISFDYHDGGITSGEAMRISKSGYVGIGTTAPNDTFSIGNSGAAPAGSSATGHNYTSTYLGTDNYALVNYGLVNTLVNSTNLWSGTKDGNIWNGTAGAGNVGIGTTAPAQKLDVSGNVKASGSFMGQSGTYISQLPWYNAGGAGVGYIKLITPIVHNESNMFHITIKTYEYGRGGITGVIMCGGYAYGAGTLISSDCHTEGTDLPVEIGTENRSGTTYVVIRMGTPGWNSWYYTHFTAEYVGWAAHDPSGFSWVSGETTPAQSGNTNNVYTDDSAGTITTTGSVGIGTTNLTSKLTVNGGTTEIRSGGTLMLRNAANDYDFDIQQVGYTLQFGSASMSNVAMTYNTTGNVGIGTTAPGAYKLNVAGDVNATSLYLADTRYISNQIQSGYATDAEDSDIWINYTGYQGGATRFRDFRVGNGKQGQIAMFDGSTGNVGIGLTNPAMPLSVVGGSTGTIRMQTANGTAPYLDIYQASVKQWGIVNPASTNRLSIVEDGSTGTERLTVATGGNVGIGTTNPQYSLDIKSGGTPLRIGSTHTGYGAVMEMDANVWGAGGRRWLVFSSGSTNGTIGGGKFALYDASGISPDSAAYRFLIDTNGNVGIGTVNPTSRLTVASDVTDYTAQIRAQSSSATNASYGGIVGLDTSGRAFYLTSGDVSLTSWYGAHAGDVTLASTANAKLHLRAGAVDTGGITIATDGKVGVGTTAPGYALDVNGTASISSNLTMGGRIYAGTFPPSTTNSGEAWMGRVTDRALGNFVVQLGGADNAPTFSVVDRAWSVNAFGVNGAGNGTFAGSVTATSFIYSSDRNLKQNIATISNPLEKITQLRGVTFNWKKDNKPSMGLIAQEVEQVFPELVTGQEGSKAVQYGNLVAPLIEAVKAQQTEIKNNNEEIAELKAQQTKMIKRLESLEVKSKKK